mgnify:CR=1 FL=1
MLSIMKQQPLLSSCVDVLMNPNKDAMYDHAEKKKKKKTKKMKTSLTLALFIVGDHHSVNRLFGIWFNPDRCAFVNFLYFIDSSKPLAFSQNRPSHVGK